MISQHCLASFAKRLSILMRLLPLLKPSLYTLASFGSMAYGVQEGTVRKKILYLSIAY